MIVPSPFDIAVETVLRHEGGFVDDPSDPGGATKYGVSLRWLRSLPEHEGQQIGDFDHDGDVDAHDIRAMTQAQAKNLYRVYWWNRYRYEQIDDLRVGTKVFDLAVNMGAKQAHLLVQRALRACGIRVTEDGVLGPQTVRAINLVHEDSLLPALRSEAAGFYRGLVAKNASFGKYLNGWLTRAYA